LPCSLGIRVSFSALAPHDNTFATNPAIADASSSGEGRLPWRFPRTTRWRDAEEVRRLSTQFLAGKVAWDNEHPGSDRKFLGAPYILLHSLSHMLLTRISLDCDYPAAALSGCTEF
jgi:hypothetical protein